MQIYLNLSIRDGVGSVNSVILVALFTFNDSLLINVLFICFNRGCMLTLARLYSYLHFVFFIVNRVI